MNELMTPKPINLPISNSEHSLSHKEPSIDEQSDNARQYALALGERVRPFEADPLHSTAYLNYLAKYLKSPFHKKPRRAQILNPGSPQRVFVQQYIIKPSNPPENTHFYDPGTYAANPIPKGNEIVFLTGRPSAEWLNIVGSRYNLDHRFFHQHLGPILANQRYRHAVPTLPSRSLEVLRLSLPSIVFIGSQGRDVDVLGLELARNDCNKQVQRALRSVQESSASEAGQSIIRRIQIHNGSALILEQDMTITLLKRDQQWTILVWTDAGNEADPDYIPIPSTDRFASVSSELAFCPIFFESQLKASEQHQVPGLIPSPQQTKQPLALLSGNYGATIKWDDCTDPSPLFVLQELLVFEAASALQYVNMLEQVLSDHLKGDKFPSYENTKLDTILHFDYAKAVLVKSELHFAEVLSFLSSPPSRWQSKTSTTALDAQSRVVALLQGDFKYLISRVERLLSICDAGKATMMSNASVQESKRSAEEAKLVTQLTKATNRVTFIFLPISYITAVFGMNFSQFGQGTLSIWLWAVFTLPLLVVSVIVVERGSWIRERFQRRKA